jgi:hypothetical protein
MAKQKQYGGVNQVFNRYKNDLLAIAQRIQASPLGAAAARLLWSLFEENSAQQWRGIAANVRIRAAASAI